MRRLERLVLILILVLAFNGGSSARASEVAKIGPDELKRAADDFYFRCATCHGPHAKGDGPMASVLTVRPADLTRIAERNGGVFPDERVFRTISGLDMMPAHGTREMPVWGDLFLGEALENSVSIEDARTAASQVTERINRIIRLPQDHPGRAVISTRDFVAPDGCIPSASCQPL